MIRVYPEAISDMAGPSQLLAGTQEGRRRGPRAPRLPAGAVPGRDLPPGERLPRQAGRPARFEEQATLEGFDFAASPKLPAAQIRDLAALRWLSVHSYGLAAVRGGRCTQFSSCICESPEHLAVLAEASFTPIGATVLAHRDLSARLCVGSVA